MNARRLELDRQISSKHAPLTVTSQQLEDAADGEVVARVPGVGQGIAVLVDELRLPLRQRLLVGC